MEEITQILNDIKKNTERLEEIAQIQIYIKNKLNDIFNMLDEMKKKIETLEYTKQDEYILGEDPDCKKIYSICNDLVGAKIQFSYTITLVNNITQNIILENCNIIGDCIENILFPFIKNGVPTIEEGPKQSAPDYYNREKSFEWELKCFTGTPGFDISNVLSYFNQLNTDKGVERKLIKTKYLVFKYSIHENYISIDDFTMCNVWNMINYTGKYPISLQNKNGTWYNIRPGNYSDFKNSTKTAKQFIESICEAIKLCPNTIKNKSNMIHNIKQQFNALSIH